MNKNDNILSKHRNNITNLAIIFSINLFSIEVLYFVIYLLKSDLGNISLYICVRMILPLFVNFISIFVIKSFLNKSIPERKKNYLSVLAIMIPSIMTIIVHNYFSQVIFVLLIPMILSSVFASKRIILDFFIISFICIVSLFFYEYFNFDLDLIDLSVDYLISVTIFVGIFLTIKYIIYYQKAKNVEISDILIKQNELVERLKLDSLTGLYNNGSIRESIKEAVDSNSKIHFAILDLDDFKSINDTYGHTIGDDVLKKLAEIIRININPNITAARYGGEEFALLFIDMETEDCYEIVDNILRSFREVNFGFYCTFSCGLARCNKNKRYVEGIINIADNALYDAKEQGKNRIVVI